MADADQVTVTLRWSLEPFDEFRDRVAIDLFLQTCFFECSFFKLLTVASAAALSHRLPRRLKTRGHWKPIGTPDCRSACAPISRTLSELGVCPQ